MTLTRYDYGIIGLGLFLSLAVGWYTGMQSPEFVLFLEKVTAYLNVPIFLVSLYFITRFAERWGGDIGRGLQIVGIGLVIQMVVWVPHILWHLQGAPQKFAVGMLGISASTWLGVFHFSGVATLLLTVAGFRLIYNDVK